MDHDSPQPLTPQAAKENLRKAARRISPIRCVQQHPFRSTSLALVAGIVAGRLRISAALAMSMAQYLLPLAAERLRRQRSEGRRGK